MHSNASNAMNLHEDGILNHNIYNARNPHKALNLSAEICTECIVQNHNWSVSRLLNIWPTFSNAQVRQEMLCTNRLIN